MTENLTDFPAGIELKDEDIYEAMKDTPGYLDITPGDFKERGALRAVWVMIT
jgi:hypothetical protein